MAYPEHEKMKAINKMSQAIGEFLLNINIQKGYMLAYYPEPKEDDDRLDCLVPVYETGNKILADYFNIDLDLIEKEKLQMLDELRKMNDKGLE